MKILRFLLFFALALLLPAIGYWLLSKLFVWFMALTGFWFYFLLFWFAFLAYRFSLQNLKLFRLRKTLLMFLGTSVFKWIQKIAVIIICIGGCIYTFSSVILPPDHSVQLLIGYWVFIYLVIQLSVNLNLIPSTDT